MPKFLIIDGSSMLSTSYYGNLPKDVYKRQPLNFVRKKHLAERYH